MLLYKRNWVTPLAHNNGPSFRQRLSKRADASYLLQTLSRRRETRIRLPFSLRPRPTRKNYLPLPNVSQMSALQWDGAHPIPLPWCGSGRHASSLIFSSASSCSQKTKEKAAPVQRICYVGRFVKRWGIWHQFVQFNCWQDWPRYRISTRWNKTMVQTERGELVRWRFWRRMT